MNIVITSTLCGRNWALSFFLSFSAAVMADEGEAGRLNRQSSKSVLTRKHLRRDQQTQERRKSSRMLVNTDAIKDKQVINKYTCELL